jgi:probable rRNA maturation factor
VKIAVEISVEAGPWPAEDWLQDLTEAAVAAATETLARDAPDLIPQGPDDQAELSILFTDDAGIRSLNARYRGQDKATNVLSFPQAASPHGPRLMGDIILAWETVSAEAALAAKPLKAHMAHLVIHGFLHLLGYDHEGDEEAETMETLERAALERMGIADPYAAAQVT